MAQVVTLGNCLNILGFKGIKSAFEFFNVASEEKIVNIMRITAKEKNLC